MDDSIVANQTNLTARFATGARARTRWPPARARARDVGELRAHRPDRAARRPLSTRIRSIPTPARSRAPAPCTDGDGATRRPRTRSTPSSSAAHWELTGGLRWDRFDVDYESVAVDRRRRRPSSAPTTMVSWRGGVVYKPRAERQRLRRLRHVVQSVGRRAVARRAATVDLEPEKTRSYEVGTKWDLLGERLSLTARGLPHREDQRAHARHQPRRSADRARRASSGSRRRARRRRAASTSGGRLLAGYAFMASEIDASNTPAEVDNALALTPEHTFNLWTTYRAAVRSSRSAAARSTWTASSATRPTPPTVPSYWLSNALALVRGEPASSRCGSTATTWPTSDYIDRVGGGHYIPGAGPLGACCHADVQVLGPRMLLQIPDVLTAEQVAHARRLLDAAPNGWTAGSPPATSRRAPRTTMQLPEGHPVGARARRA